MPGRRIRLRRCRLQSTTALTILASSRTGFRASAGRAQPSARAARAGETYRPRCAQRSRASTGVNWSFTSAGTITSSIPNFSE